MSSSQSVAREIDKFIEDKESYYWFVKLSNGETVYEDDDRPELEEKNAWKRLKGYCDLNKLHVVEFNLKFYSNHVSIPTADWPGVFFIKSLLGFIRVYKDGAPVTPRRYPTKEFYNIGKVDGDKIFVQKWEMPPILLKSNDDRVPSEDDRLLIIYNEEIPISK